MTFKQWVEALETGLDWENEENVLQLLQEYPQFIQECSTRKWNITPLQRMVYAMMERAVRCWIELGGNVHGRACDGSTALHAAAEQGMLQLASLLLDNGAEVSAEANGMTPLACASERRDEIGQQIADLLLDHGASLDLHDAVWLDRPQEVMRIVTEHPTSIQTCRQPTRLLHDAIAMDVDTPVILQILLEHGANPNLAHEDFGPPIVEAVKYGSSDALRLLLEHGADVNVQDADGKSLMDVAREHEREPEVLELLEIAGATGS